MVLHQHPNARTTPRIRQELKASTLPSEVLAKQYNLSVVTVRKWRQRESMFDASHRPHTLHANLSPEQEMVVVELRETLLLPLDDLLAVTHEFINTKVTRSGLDRCLRRHGVSNLKQMLKARETTEEEVKPPKKTFKDYDPGFIHVDIKYLPRMADEKRRKYLFVAIDRATRWVYLEILSDKSARSAERFMHHLLKVAPFTITRLLTDNGKEFTDRYCATGERQPTGNHPLDKLCTEQGIEHRLTKPRHPQTNGMVERFNGRISEVLATTHFDSSRSLKETLTKYNKLYNHSIPQKALGHITPIQAMKKWYAKKPGLFVKRIYNQAGLDT